jgi:hypothetical protein
MIAAPLPVAEERNPPPTGGTTDISGSTREVVGE